MVLSRRGALRLTEACAGVQGVWLRDYEPMPQRQNRSIVGDTLGEGGALQRLQAPYRWQQLVPEQAHHQNRPHLGGHAPKHSLPAATGPELARHLDRHRLMSMEQC